MANISLRDVPDELQEQFEEMALAIGARVGITPDSAELIAENQSR
jgi:hypothetical protein